MQHGCIVAIDNLKGGVGKSTLAVNLACELAASRNVFLVDADAPQEVKDFLRTYYMRYSGPAGMTEQDDMENWNYATAGSRGVIAKRYPYNYVQSLGKVQSNGPVPGNVSLQVSEENPRQFYRRWRDYMNGADWDTLLGRRDTGPASLAD